MHAQRKGLDGKGAQSGLVRCFITEFKCYMRGKELDFKVLLLVDPARNRISAAEQITDSALGTRHHPCFRGSLYTQHPATFCWDCGVGSRFLTKELLIHSWIHYCSMSPTYSEGHSGDENWYYECLLEIKCGQMQCKTWQEASLTRSITAWRRQF